MIEIVEATLEAAEFIVRNIRARDRIEIQATAFDKSLETLARQSMEMPGVKRIVLLNGEPVFIAGLTLCYDKCVQAWGYGTDKTKRIVKTATAEIKRIIDLLVSAGEIVRVQALCMASVAPLSWLDMIGLSRSAEIGAINGEDFILKWGEYGRLVR